MALAARWVAGATQRGLITARSAGRVPVAGACRTMVSCLAVRMVKATGLIPCWVAGGGASVPVRSVDQAHEVGP